MYQVTEDNVVDKGVFTVNCSKTLPYENNQVHYVILKEKDGSYSSVCLELMIECNHQDLSVSKDKIIETANQYLSEIFIRVPDDKSAFEFLLELNEKNEINLPFWNIFLENSSI